MKAFISYVIVKEPVENMQLVEYGNFIEDDFEPTERGIWEVESALSRHNSGHIHILNFVPLLD